MSWDRSLIADKWSGTSSSGFAMPDVQHSSGEHADGRCTLTAIDSGDTAPIPTPPRNTEVGWSNSYAGTPIIQAEPMTARPDMDARSACTPEPRSTPTDVHRHSVGRPSQRLRRSRSQSRSFALPRTARRRQSQGPTLLPARRCQGDRGLASAGTAPRPGSPGPARGAPWRAGPRQCPGPCFSSSGFAIHTFGEDKARPRPTKADNYEIHLTRVRTPGEPAGCAWRSGTPGRQ